MLLQIVGELIFREDSVTWHSLGEPERRQILERAEMCRFNLELLFYFYLRTTLPPDKQKEYAILFRNYNLIVQSSFLPTLNQLEALLRARKTDYALLKGMYFAWNAYPHPVLRVRGDLDILVREEHGAGLHRDIVSAGGIFYGDFPAGHKHLPALAWNGRKVEIHTHLFNPYPGRCESEMLWNYTEPSAGDSNRYDLIPELHWLMRIGNVYEDRWCGMLRMLVDLAFLQKKFRLDENVIRGINHELNFGIDLAFPYYAAELWPPEQRLFPPLKPPPRAYRDWLWEAGKDDSNRTRNMLLYGALHRKSWWERIRFLAGKLLIHPAKIRMIYTIPRHHYCRLLAGYLHNVGTKVRSVWRYWRQHPDTTALRKIAQRHAMDTFFRKN